MAEKDSAVVAASDAAPLRTSVLERLTPIPTGLAACCGASHYGGWPSEFYDYDLLVGRAPDYVAFNKTRRPLTDEEKTWIIDRALGVKLKDIRSYDNRPRLPGGNIHPQAQLGGALSLAILNTKQRPIWHDKFIEYGFVELACGFNYANDCHLYVITRKRPAHISEEEWLALPMSPKVKATNVEKT